MLVIRDKGDARISKKPEVTENDPDRSRYNMLSGSCIVATLMQGSLRNKKFIGGEAILSNNSKDVSLIPIQRRAG